MTSRTMAAPPPLFTIHRDDGWLFLWSQDHYLWPIVKIALILKFQEKKKKNTMFFSSHGTVVFSTLWDHYLGPAFYHYY